MGTHAIEITLKYMTLQFVIALIWAKAVWNGFWGRLSTAYSGMYFIGLRLYMCDQELRIRMLQWS